ncbi:Ubiquitin-like-specific protease 1, partial [Frankliniella fusca]
MERTPRDRRPPKKDYTTPDVIKGVREHPVLWDKQCPGYHDNSKKAEAWAKIASRFYNFSAKKACKVWENARKALCNQKNRKAAAERSGMGAKKKVKDYIYAEQMSFLKGNDITETQVSSLDNDESDDTSDPDITDEDHDGDDDDDDEDDEDDMTDDEKISGIEFSVRQQLQKTGHKRTLQPLTLNFQKSERDKSLDDKLKVDKIFDLNANEFDETFNNGSFDEEDKENQGHDQMEKAKRAKDDRRLKAKQAREKKRDAKRDERLKRIAEKVRARGHKNFPPLNQERKPEKEGDNLQTMEVVIREPPPPQEQTPTTLFFLSIAGRVNALPADTANELTLPILHLVVEAEKKVKQSLDHSQTHTESKMSKLKRVEQALKMPEDSVAVKGFGYELRGRDIHTLRPNTWLNDQVINMYLRLIEKRSEADTDLPSVKAFSTFLYPTLLKGFDRDVVSNDGVDKNIILVPLHHDYGHWSLISVESITKTVTLYDSLERKTTSALEDIGIIMEHFKTIIPGFKEEEWFKIHEL